MTVDMNRYKDLKKECIRVALPHTTTVLLYLSHKYEQVINSKRALDSCSTIETIFTLLEKRNVLSFQNVQVFEDCALCIKDETLLKKINRYKKWYTREGVSTIVDIYQYAMPPTQVFSRALPQTSTQPQITTHKPPAMDFEKEQFQQNVFATVSNQLGRYWTDVARLLGITEFEINELERKYCFSDKECAFEALKLFAARSDVHWEFSLMKALEGARRRDLKELVRGLLLNRNT